MQLCHLHIVLWQIPANGTIVPMATIEVQKFISLGKVEAEYAVQDLGAVCAIFPIFGAGRTVGLSQRIALFRPPLIRLPFAGCLVFGRTVSLLCERSEYAS